MNRFFQRLFKNALQRRFRLRAGLAAICWLVLHMQLAIAAHHAVNAMPEHQAVAAQPALAFSAATHHAEQQMLAQPVCEKHCHPDNAHSVGQMLHPCTLHADTTLLLIEQTDESLPGENKKRAARITGPPAEIRFCRFRE